MKILSTKDYSLFNLHKKNRKIDYKKVQKLSEAMKFNNLLPVFPVVVDTDMTILDGQHRFEAAKLAKATIYYIVSDGIYDIGNVAESNNFQSHWKIEDYINYFAKESKEEYLKILDLSKKYKMSGSKIVNLGDNKRVAEEIKTGKFKFVDIQDIIDLLHHAKALGIEYAFDHWNSRPFLRALKHIMAIKKYNKLRMGQRIKKNRLMLKKCHEAEEYIKLLEEIYNTGAIEQIRFL